MDVVSEDFDLLDPCPDIHSLFVLYNDLYFGGQLGACSVEWASKRMTSCAGVCYSKPGGGCIIRLSEALLKFRPTVDLKETLLHEMIHALHFLLRIRDDDAGGHGTKFKEKMNSINNSSVYDPQRPPGGYNISVTHNFYAEVDHFRQHWWQCSKCSRVVKRSMNRPPQKADCPWKLPENAQCGCAHHVHIRNCGGEFKKIKEPDTAKNKRGKPTKVEFGNQKSIADFFSSGAPDGERNGGGHTVAGDGMLSSGGGLRSLQAPGSMLAGELGPSGVEVFKGKPNFLGQAPKMFYPGQDPIKNPDLTAPKLWLRHVGTSNPLGPTGDSTLSESDQVPAQVSSHVTGKRKTEAVEMIDLITPVQHAASVLDFVNRRKNRGLSVGGEDTSRRKYVLMKSLREGVEGNQNCRREDNCVIDLT